ncbi:uncharacterized protein [Temnothorax longispinosus]|uniref:uncharacterized protein isoform X2 n=1 Tax=Temnothorax longispinosus TaxID=300112 RepID=UPI003A991DA9
MGPSAEDGTQKRPDPQIVKQLLTSLETIQEAVKSAFESLEHDSPPVPTLKQMTKDSDAVDKPSTSASTVSNMGPSAEQRIQEWLVAREQLKTNFVAIDKAVESAFKTLEQYSRPVPLPERTTKDPGAVDKTSSSTSTGYDINPPAERRSGDQPDLQTLLSEQTRKRKGAVDENTGLEELCLISQPIFKNQNFD